MKSRNFTCSWLWKHLLNSSASDNQLYRRMFPDADIANSFQHADTNVKFVMQYRIKSYVFNLILTNVKDQPFRFILMKPLLAKWKSSMMLTLCTGMPEAIKLSLHILVLFLLDTAQMLTYYSILKHMCSEFRHLFIDEAWNGWTQC